MQRLVPFFICILTVALTGCYEERQQITLNPDGSGKAIVEIVRPVGMSMQDEEEDFDLQERLRETIAAMVEKADGVEAWKDLEFRYQPDGRMLFRGTAYFPNISQFRINALAAKNTSGSGSFPSDFKIGPSQDGLELIGSPGKKEEERINSSPVSDSFHEKVEYQQTRGLALALFDGMRIERTIRMPGKIVEASGFAANGQTLTYLFEGAKALQAINRLGTDDKLWQDLAAEGKGSGDLQEWAEREIIGAPLRARIEGPLKFQFDYASEVKRAKETWEKEKQQLIAASPEKDPRASAKSGETVPMEGARLVSVSMTLLDNKTAPGLPLSGKRGWQARIIVSLPVAVTAVEKGELKKVLAGDGTDLLPKDETDRRISFPNLADGRHIIANLPDLELPADLAKGVQEISGEFACLTSVGEKLVDLGVMTTEKGNKGQDLQAEITDVSLNPWDPTRHELDLHLGINGHFIKDFAIEDEAGKPIKAARTTSNYGGESFTQTFSLDNPWPQKVRVKVLLHDNAVEHKVPFTIEHLNFSNMTMN